MKKIVLSSIMLFSFGTITFGQTTATDFTANDCSGASHTLFSELDAGKVIVMAFVMPCGSCAGPSLSAYNEAQSYNASYPGRVLFYLSDDLANTSCSTLNSWATTNGMGGVTSFSSTLVKMSDYGTSGMPKIIVLGGGTTHGVYYNANNSISVPALDAAIVAALSGAGVNDNNIGNFQMNLFPSPAKEKVSVEYTLVEASNVSYEIYNVLGEKVRTTEFEKQAVGKHEKQIELETLSNGVYFLKLIVGETTETKKFSISR